MLEMDNSELLMILEMEEQLKIKVDEAFLLHGYGYTKSDPTVRTHITVKTVPHGPIAMTTESTTPTLTLQPDVADKAQLAGTALALDAVSKFHDDCEAFGELLHETVEIAGGKHGYHEHTTSSGKADAIEMCNKVRGKMERIETLSFHDLKAAVRGVSTNGMETMTVILEKTTQVKFSKKIMTSPIAIDIEHKDGQIHRLTSYMTEAKGLVEKYGDRYAGGADMHEGKSFMRRPWDKKAWEPSPQCSKFADKGPMAIKGCEICLARDQPIDECMSCGGKCMKSVCDPAIFGSDEGHPEQMKQCFKDVMEDASKREAMHDCYKTCMGTDSSEAPVEEGVMQAVEEFHKEATHQEDAKFAHVIEMSVELKMEAASPDETP